MEARLDFFGNAVATKVVKHLNSAGAAVSNSALRAATQELVKLRASQINGCAFCTDMHSKACTRRGQQRLNLVAAWREATVFTEAERASAGARRAGHPHRQRRRARVSDEAWANAAKHYDDDRSWRWCLSSR